MLLLDFNFYGKNMNEEYVSLINQLKKDCRLPGNELLSLIYREQDFYNDSDYCSPEICTSQGSGFDKNDSYLFHEADLVRRENYGRDVYIRGLIEFTNYCKNNCYYCGIRRDNSNLTRYRLTPASIIECCREGYELGFYTFVLQGGEDLSYSDKELCNIIYNIKVHFPMCAITLSLGERSTDSYKAFYNAGADRYLLRHETALASHYSLLHPQEMSLDNRKKCLYNLKEIGYQTGSGFMVGAPYETPEAMLENLSFLRELQPDMIGIGPFISHKDTPFSAFGNGKLIITLRLISILRLMFPFALIPATTALGTIHPKGRELGLQCGANVVMPNLSPVDKRSLYSLYDNKICTGEEAAQCINCLKQRVSGAGYTIVTGRGDVKKH